MVGIPKILVAPETVETACRCAGFQNVLKDTMQGSAHTLGSLQAKFLLCLAVTKSESEILTICFGR